MRMNSLLNRVNEISSWDVQQATFFVCGHAQDAQEASQFLKMLGLDPRGNTQGGPDGDTVGVPVGIDVR